MKYGQREFENFRKKEFISDGIKVAEADKGRGLFASSKFKKDEEISRINNILIWDGKFLSWSKFEKIQILQLCGSHMYILEIFYFYNLYVCNRLIKFYRVYIPLSTFIQVTFRIPTSSWSGFENDFAQHHSKCPSVRLRRNDDAIRCTWTFEEGELDPLALLWIAGQKFRTALALLAKRQRKLSAKLREGR